MKFFLIITGTISLILGIIGIIVPILPTTPFLLLSANLYLHSSPRLHQKLVNSKYIGTYIKNYKNGKGIPVKSKVFMISLLWLSLGYSIFVPLSSILWLQLLLTFIGICVTIHILLIGKHSFKKNKQKEH